jgi:two-component system response regulator YesN
MNKKSGMAELLSEDMDAFRDAFILERLAGARDLSEDKTQRRMQILNIGLQGPRYTVIVYSPYVMSMEADFIDRTLADMERIIQDGYQKNGFECYTVTDSYRNTVAVLSIRSKQELEKSDAVTEKITETILSKCKIDIFVGIGNTIDQFSQIHKSREAAKEALAYKFSFARNHVVWAKDVERIYNESSLKLEEYTNRILGCFYDGNVSMLVTRLDELIAAVQDTMEDPLGTVKNLCIEMTAVISQRMREIGLNMFQGKPDVYAAILDMRSMDELTTWFIEMCSSAISRIAELRVDKNTQVVNLALAYIEENLGNCDLSVQTISDHVSLSTTYFGSLFYEKFNTHVVEYVTKRRIEEAKKLLLKTNLKVGAISERVGFSSANYFNNVFKKSTGVPPQQYRLQFRNAQTSTN